MGNPVTAKTLDQPHFVALLSDASGRGFKAGLDEVLRVVGQGVGGMALVAWATDEVRRAEGRDQGKRAQAERRLADAADRYARTLGERLETIARKGHSPPPGAPGSVVQRKNLDDAWVGGYRRAGAMLGAWVHAAATTAVMRFFVEAAAPLRKETPRGAPPPKLEAHPRILEAMLRQVRDRLEIERGPNADELRSQHAAVERRRRGEGAQEAARDLQAQLRLRNATHRVRHHLAAPPKRPGG
jgi:hypothetical protein